MDTLDLKQLKKIADACRKAGIKTFKGYGYEFTLGDAPQKQYKSKKAATKESVEQPKEIPTDSWDNLTEEQKILWSVGELPNQGEQ